MIISGPPEDRSDNIKKQLRLPLKRRFFGTRTTQSGQRSPAGAAWLMLQKLTFTLLSPASLVVAITILGGILRFYDYTRLSLWLDEGFTVFFARLDWLTVLGLKGAYDPSPPLYYAIVKLASIVVSEVAAGRLVSVLAGTFTIPVVYALASRLLDRKSAVLASAVLAISPLHIWYSQEARQYALAGLLVSLSYLALVRFYNSPRWAWAFSYSISTLLALYVSYSTIYVFIPQAVLIVMILVRHTARANIRLIVASVAVGAYVPWIPQLIGTMGAVGTQRAGYLGVSLYKIFSSLLSIIGIAGQGSYFWGGLRTPWDYVSGGIERSLLILCFSLVVLVGVVALKRKSWFAFATVSCLFIGTILTAALLSLLSPGYADRTVIYAVIGWAILFAGGFSIKLSVKWLRVPLVLTLACAFTLPVITLRAIYTADKQDWRALAEDVSAVSAFDQTIVTYPTITPTLIDVYHPTALKRSIALDDSGNLDRLKSEIQNGDVYWLVYQDYGVIEQIDALFKEFGFSRIMHKYYYHPLHLDLYVRAPDNIGHALPIDTRFSPKSLQSAGWDIPPQHAVTTDPLGDSVLTLKNRDPSEQRVLAGFAARPGNLYVLGLDTQSILKSGIVREFLLCGSEKGIMLAAPDGGGASVPNDGKWHRVYITALCPKNANGILVDLRNAGFGDVLFRRVSLRELSPDGR